MASNKLPPALIAKADRSAARANGFLDHCLTNLRHDLADETDPIIRHIAATSTALTCYEERPEALIELAGAAVARLLDRA